MSNASVNIIEQKLQEQVYTDQTTLNNSFGKLMADRAAN